MYNIAIFIMTLYNYIYYVVWYIKNKDKAKY
jgi:hypothetical protein